MKVLLDIDGVLADFVKGACDLHGARNPYLDEDNLGHYEIQELIGISGAAFWEPMGEEFWANLPLTSFAKPIADTLINHYGLQNVCLLTSPVRTPGCVRGKMRWIRKYFPRLARQFLIGPMKEVCAHSNSILFDDYPGNIEKFKVAGGNTFLVPAPWNSKAGDHPFHAILAELIR